MKTLLWFIYFSSVSLQVQFDLVVSAFTLSELQSVKDREEAVFTLWRKTSSYLVGSKNNINLLIFLSVQHGDSV